MKVLKLTLLTSDDLVTLKKLEVFFMERSEYRGWVSSAFCRALARFFREAAYAVASRGSLSSDERPVTGARLMRRPV